jgi:hypothetical protein
MAKLSCDYAIPMPAEWAFVMAKAPPTCVAFGEYRIGGNVAESMPVCDLSMPLTAKVREVKVAPKGKGK